jgi:hypothetical protein
MDAGERSLIVSGIFSAIAVSKEILAMKNTIKTITTEPNLTLILRL